MIQQIDIFIDQLATQSGFPEKGPVNMTPQTKYLAIDIMGHLLFEYPLRLQTESEHRHMTYSRGQEIRSGTSFDAPTTLAQIDAAMGVSRSSDLPYSGWTLETWQYASMACFLGTMLMSLQ